MALHIDFPHGLSLSDLDESLLEKLYPKATALQVLREFGGGLSGNRVLQVQASDERGTFLTQVVKIGIKDEMSGEKVKYEKYYCDRLNNAAPISGYEEEGRSAAIIYGDAHAAAALSPVRPFAHYFKNSEPYLICNALCAILEKGLGQVYSHYHAEKRTYKQLLAKFLPENLVVSLKDEHFEVYSSSDKPKHRSPAKKLTPRDVDRFNFTLSPGETILLENFPISKVQFDDLNLEDKDKKRYKIKVRFDGRSVTGFSAGDSVNIVATYITERNERLRFAVADCLQRYGLKSSQQGYVLGAEVYPEPVQLLDSIIDDSCHVAWGTIHGDLHWDNIMLSDPSNWWLIDYGLTGDGPVLFDFIKLELYLRHKELAGLPHLTPEALSAFEQALLDNPFGHLTNPELENPDLAKALLAVQAIRRMAKRYIMTDLFEYYKLMFVYGLALAKYYPTTDKWEASATDTAKLARLEKSGRQLFFTLVAVLMVGRLLKWANLRDERPALKYEFTPMGESLSPEEGTVVLDVGNQLTQGVVDHHHIKESMPECTTSLVWKKSELITGHIGTQNSDDVTWLVHKFPDFDCAASVYLAWHKVKLGYFPPGANELQQYAFTIDAGTSFLETVRSPERTPYALFALHSHSVDPILDDHDADSRRMCCGFEVLDYLCYQEAIGNHTMDANMVPHEHEFWDANAARDRAVFERYDLRPDKTLATRIPVDGHLKSVEALFIDAPRSLLFKAWARRSEYDLLVVLWPNPYKPDHRIVVSVPPRMENALRGLGKALEKEEEKKRKKLGKERPGPPEKEPRWPDVNNSDPWYDGRSPIHAYTIVDSPKAGTVLTLDEVLKIVKKGSWF